MISVSNSNWIDRARTLVTSKRRTLRLLLIVLGCMALGITGPVAASAQASGSLTTALAPAAVPPAPFDWGDLDPGGVVIGATDPATPITIYFSLIGADPAGLQAKALAVSDPQNADYGNYLSLEQATTTFGASTAARQQVSDAVAAAGGTTTFGPVNTFARATLTVGQAAAWFATTFQDHQADVPPYENPQIVAAPVAAPTLPAALVGIVDAALGLSFIPNPTTQTASVGPPVSHTNGDVSVQASLTPATPTLTGTAEGCQGALEAGSFTPNQLATAYGYDALHKMKVTGTGVRMAVLEEDGNVLPSDLQTYAECFDLTLPPFHQVNVGGPHTDSGADGEAILDVQVAMQVAPGLEALDLYSYNGNPGGITALGTLETLALPLTPSIYTTTPGAPPPDIVSYSYGGCEYLYYAGSTPAVTMSERMLAVATTTGMSYFVSSGDAGSSVCLGGGASELTLASPSYPSTSQWVTSVGGTALTLNPDNSIGAEAVWNDALYPAPFYLRPSASSGGTSALVGTDGLPMLPRPTWQTGTGVPAGDTRLNPDVASFADSAPGWTVYCTSQGCAKENLAGYGQMGGTSASSPQVAAMFALMTQMATAVGQPSPGFAAPLLYELGRAGGTNGLRDVTQGNNDVANTGCCNATPAWDITTGWGSINASLVAAALFGPPAPTDVTAEPGYLSAVLTFKQPASATPVVGYEFSINGGANWLPAVEKVGPPDFTSVQLELFLPNGVPQQVMLRAVDDKGTPGVAAGPVPLAAPEGGVFRPITPTRVFDSRSSSGPLTPGQNVAIPTCSVGPCPPTFGAVTYNITVTDTQGAGFLSVVPTFGGPLGGQGNGSTINWSGPGQTIANATMVMTGSGSSITVYASGGSAQVIVDVMGYFLPDSVLPNGDVFIGVDPVRAYDSRTADGPLGSGGQRIVDVSAGGVVPPGATAVAYTLTETNTQGTGFLGVVPAGSSGPQVSTINWWQSGQTMANSSTVQVTNGKVVVAAGGSGATQFVVDILGYYAPEATTPSGKRFTPVLPTRAYDSRAGSAWSGPLTNGQSRTTTTAPPTLDGLLPIPPGASAAAFNLTITDTAGTGFLTATPGGTAVAPLASTINWFGPGQTWANGSQVAVTGDQMTTFAGGGGSSQYVVDVLGYYN